MEIVMNAFAMVIDTEGTVSDRRRRGLQAAGRRPAQGSRLIHSVDCFVPDCAAVEHMTTELLRDPSIPEPGYERPWQRAIITAVRPSGAPGQPWRALFETTRTRGDFALDDAACKLLGNVTEATATLALEREVFVHVPDAGVPQLFAISADDEQLPGGRPSHAAVREAPTRLLNPTDACPCLSCLDFRNCHGVLRPTPAMLGR